MANPFHGIMGLFGSVPPAPMPPTKQADPLDFSAKYNTPIPPDKQAAFNQWVTQQKQKTGRDPLGDRYDYDVNGFWLSGGGQDARGHGSDQFKKPNHPTFSDESQYHGVDGNYGGKWISSNGSDFYEPSATNINFHGVDNLKEYFQKVEPETQLLVPPQSPSSIGNAAIGSK